MMDSIRTGTIRLQIPDFLSDGNNNNMFAFFEHLLVKIVNWKVELENMWKGHKVQHSKWSSSMANINLYKLHT